METVFMSQLVQAYDGWKNLLFKDNHIEHLAATRGAICDQCPHKRKLTCGHCGCPLEAKLRAEDTSCPIRKW